MSGSHFDPAIVRAFVQLFDTNVLRDLDLTTRHDHGEDEHPALAA